MSDLMQLLKIFHFFLCYINILENLVNFCTILRNFVDYLWKASISVLFFCKMQVSINDIQNISNATSFFVLTVCRQQIQYFTS